MLNCQARVELFRERLESHPFMSSRRVHEVLQTCARTRTHARTCRRAAQHRRCALCGWRSPAGEARAAVGGLACGACSPRAARCAASSRTRLLCRSHARRCSRRSCRGSSGSSTAATTVRGSPWTRRRTTAGRREQVGRWMTGRGESQHPQHVNSSKQAAQSPRELRRLFARRKCARGNALAPGVEWCRGCAQLRRMHLPDSH